LAAAALAVLAWHFASSPVRAQDSTTTFQTRLQELASQKTSFSVEFAKPLVSGESVWTIPQDGYSLGEVGDDFVCFSQPWNDGQRQRCTPFSNIVSVSFLTQ
jgi:hypothetical protein